MNHKLLVAIVVAAISSFVVGCSTTNVDSYSNPAYNSSAIKSVAVMPITNQRLNAGQAIETNRRLISALQQRNPQMKIIAGTDAITTINDKNLVDPWNNFIVGYAQTGLPNTNTLKAVAGALDVDAIVVGTIVRVREQDAAAYVYPFIEVSMRYTMFDKNGTVLWEVSSDAKQDGYASKPPMSEVVNTAMNHIIEQLPK
jgi:hypothetical protein